MQLDISKPAVNESDSTQRSLCVCDTNSYDNPLNKYLSRISFFWVQIFKLVDYENRSIYISLYFRIRTSSINES